MQLLGAGGVVDVYLDTPLRGQQCYGIQKRRGQCSDVRGMYSRDVHGPMILEISYRDTIYGTVFE